MLADCEHRKEDGAESNARDGGRGFGKEIGYGDQKQHQSDQAQPDRDFCAGDLEVAGNFPLAWFLMSEAEHQHGQRFEREAPDNSKSIKRRQQIDVSSTQDNRQYLKADDQID